ncbi:MAG TPA: GNAT family N-acetyltransferase [Acidimicrobiales bacterium]|nr:GNAT family N-acetyltransferase [Acidimicrobiales bacterium]
MDGNGVAPIPACEELDQRRIDGFGGVRWAWQELGANARYFFQPPEWMEVVAARVEDDLAWGAVTDSGRPVAVSVLRHAQRGPAGLGLRVLSEVRPNVWFTDCLLDARAGARNAVTLDDVVGASGAWDVLWLGGLRAGSPWLELAVGRARVNEEPNDGVGILDTPLGDDAWRRRLPKNMRETIRKARRRIEACGGSEIVSSTGAELPAAYEEFVALEASGWKGVAGTALLQRSASRDLLRDYLCVARTAQVRSLRIGDRLAASQVTVEAGGSLVLLKLAYDEQFAHLSPGNFLMANLVEKCCEDPTVDRIDLIGWQEWCQRWGMVREPTYRLVAFNHRSVRGVIVGSAWNARRLLSRQRGWRIAEIQGR